MPGASALDPEVMLRRRAERTTVLQQTLRTGGDTRPVRTELKAIDRQTAALQALEATALKTVRERTAETVEANAAEIETACRSRVLTVIENLLPPEVTPPAEVSLEHEGYIAGVALHVAQTRSDLTRAQGTIQAAEREVWALRERIVAMDQCRAEIIGRRRDDEDSREDDAEKIALLDADMEGLRTLLAEAEARVENARAPVQEARSMAAKAMGDMERVEAAAKLAVLVWHATRVGEILGATLTELEATRARTGGRPVWNVGRGLYSQIRKSAAAFNLL
jgi:chromosome segregation ATPase